MASISQLTARLVDLFGTPSTANPAKLLNNLQVSPNGNVLVGTGTDDGVNKFQVTGATKFYSAVTYSVRPTFNGATPWDTTNLARPAYASTSNNVIFDWGIHTAGQIGVTIDTSYQGYLWHSGNLTYPCYSNAGHMMAFNWSGQSGTPPWLWGGSDGTNMYVYNPANFSVNYATSAGSVGGVSNPFPATGGTVSGTVGVTGNITCNGTANLGWVTSSYLTSTNTMANGSSGTYAGYNQGSYLAWNDSNGGGEGMLCCNKGGGSGGWVLRTVNVNNSAESGRYTISAAGVGTNGSDIRLKKDVATLEDSLSKIRQVRAVSYTYKNTDEKHMGVIAQEIQPIFPDVVTVTHDDHEHTDLLGVSYTDLIAPLIQSVQQLADKLDAANQRIEALEAQLKEKQ
jgi:hypothetical protein